MKKFLFKRNGFTLIELLVVIAIISMLAGQLLPALSTAREKGRQANCINNLHQMGLAIEIYYQDYNNYPTWLSLLYKSYLGTPKIFICLTDLNKGENGCGNPVYPSLNDVPVSQIPDYTPDTFDSNAYNLRNHEITACSYSYEFAPTKSGWFIATHTLQEQQEADTNSDGVITWKEAKMWQSNNGYGGQAPIVRCYWHFYNYGQKVLNLAYRDYNVYPSNEKWELTSN